MTSWPAESIATFAAAVAAALIAAVVGLGSITATLINGRQSRRQAADHARLDQLWAKWSWTSAKVLSDSDEERRIGMTTLAIAVDISRNSVDDIRIARVLTEAQTRFLSGDEDEGDRS